MIIEKTLRQFTKRSDMGLGFVYIVRDQALFTLRLWREAGQTRGDDKIGYQTYWLAKALSGLEVHALAQRFAEEYEDGNESNLPARFFSTYDLPEGHGHHPLADCFVWFPLEKDRKMLDWYDLEMEAIHDKFLKEEGEHVTRCQYRLIESFINFPRFFVEALNCNLKGRGDQAPDPKFIFTMDHAPFFRQESVNDKARLNVDNILREAFSETSGIVSRAEADEVIDAASARIEEFCQKKISGKKSS